MKKLVALLFCSFSVLASPKEELSHRLALTDGFSAQFSQEVISPDGDPISDSKGKVDITRPSLFRWETKQPDENLLVSNGKTLWYYTPLVEQVTIYDAEKASEQTPFVLLTRNKESDWDNYFVSQDNDSFTLTPTNIDSTQGRFTIKIDKKGTVKGFDVIEQDGQETHFTFNHMTYKKPDSSLFHFVVPKGVEVDDQR
ncbi:outer membrane lipoprotein chaperone LolA [Vibrio viridaestus]|uniref:Outer-membrane lipoprotein carrier protein n=1 Tax=Vibrio viridaestus TaxID=2487322 RepID=A0A3N9TCV9_9VIBR|nr:outer membrane lipoprotein chaperone LolA [Vibrio viridaestus]RQW62001.1 outer membrane lipoprotein chaperone LolA [Vibrio viridaestus]